MASLWKIAAALLLAICVNYVYSAISYRRRMKGAKPVPGPRGLPFLGNVKDMDNGSLVLKFREWAEQYGPIMQFSVLGQNMIVLSSEKACQDLFVKRGELYSDRGAPTAISYIANGMVPALMDKTDRWRRGRKFLHSYISPLVLDKYEPTIELESTYTLRDLVTTPAAFRDHLNRYSNGVIYRIVLGQRVKSTSDPIMLASERQTNDLLGAFRPDLYPANLFPSLLKLPRWLMPSNGKLADIRQDFDAEQNMRMEKLKADVLDDSKATPDSWSKSYLFDTQEKAGLSEKEVIGAFGSLTQAGTRSPWNAVMSLILALLDHPEWHARMQKEVDNVVGPDRLPQCSDSPNLPTVRAVLKESSRWRSIEAELGIPHQIKVDDFYEGYFVPAGTIVHANYSTILTDKAMYPDGRVFNPERWLSPNFPTYKEPLTTYPNLQGFTAFGYGRRACPGYNFAERTLIVMVARLIWAFDIRHKVDPKTGEKIEVVAEYAPTPNPSLSPFECDFVPRSKEKTALIMKEAKEAEKNDKL